jgi:hypothetical protein
MSGPLGTGHGGQGGRGLPATIVKPEEYVAGSALVLDNCDSTAGWATIGGGAPALDAAVKTEGTASVKGTLGTEVGTSDAIYKDFGTPPALGGRAILSLDFRWDKTNAALFEGFELHVSDQAALANPHTVFKLGDLPEDTWVTGRVWVNGPIRTLGVRKMTDFSNSVVSLTAFFDNIQMAAMNTREQALAAAAEVAVLEEPAYTAAQSYLEIPADKFLWDFQETVEVWSKKGRLRRRILGIPLDGSADGSVQLMWALCNLAPDEHLVIPWDSEILANISPIVLRNVEGRVTWNRVKIYSTVRRTTDFVIHKGCRWQKNHRGPQVFGFRSDERNGSALTSIATNMLSPTQASFEDRTTTGWSAGANTSLSATDSLYLAGQFGLRMQSVAAGDVSAVVTTRFGVEASTSYSLDAYFRPIAVGGKTCQVELEWYDSGGALISTSVSTGLIGDISQWVHPTVTATSPANATEVRPVLKVLATTGANEQHFVDKIKLKRGTARTITATGSTKELSKQGDEVACPQVNGFWRGYARNKDYETVVEFSLSGSLGNPNNAEVSIYDARDDTLLARKTVTAGAQGTHEVRFEPTELDAPLKLAARKTNNDGDVITVHTSTEYGRNDYIGTYEFSSGVAIRHNCYDVEYDELDIEGTGGYGLSVDAGAQWYTNVRSKVRRYFSRCNNTQGAALTAAVDAEIEDFKIILPGRSGLDMEPYASNWRLVRPKVRRGEIRRAENYAMPMSNWQNIFHPEIEDVRAFDCEVGLIIGGGHHARIRNIDHFLTTPAPADPGDFDVQLYGYRMKVDGVGAARGVILRGGASAGATLGDDGRLTNPISQGNDVTGVRPTSENQYVRTHCEPGAGRIRLAGGVIEGGIATPATGGLYYGAGRFEAGESFLAVEWGPYAGWTPNTHDKGPAFDKIHFPRGLAMQQEPILDIRGLSGDGVRPNNFGRRNIVVGAGATFVDVDFTTYPKPYGQFATGWSVTAKQNGAGALAAATYYYRVAARPVDGGPVPALAQKSVVVGAPNNAVQVKLQHFADFATGYQIAGATIFRGTVSGGPYDTRYDIIPTDLTEILHAIRSDFGAFDDNGSQLVWVVLDAAREFNYPATVAALAGSWTAADVALDETAYEIDANFVVDGIETNWNSGHPWISNRVVLADGRCKGFRINFPNAGPGDGSGRAAFSMKRLPT